MTRYGPVVLRSGTPGDAARIHALIEDNREGGRLLPREVREIAFHSSRFVVAVHPWGIVGCAELAPLSRSVAEVRSLAVDRRVRRKGIGAMLVDEVRQRARQEAYFRLGAYTRAPMYFAKLGFLVVPHARLSEEAPVYRAGFSHGNSCGRFAVVMPLESAVAATDHRGPAASSDLRL